MKKLLPVPPGLASPPGTNLLSRLLGDMVHRPLPAPVLKAMIHTYANMVGVDLTEVAEPLESFSTFADFFTRRIKPELRPIDGAAHRLVSPVDGAVHKLGRIAEGRLEQVKGHSYTIASFLKDDERAAAYQDGWYLVLYLSPADYHRVHSPCEGMITGWDYVPGHLVSVQPLFYNLVSGLLVSNERVHTHMDTNFGAVTVSKVGACGVGRIHLSYDDLTTNVPGIERSSRTYKTPVPIARGAELGMFDLGSTVVILSDNPALSPVGSLNPGEKVRLGQPVFELKTP